MRRSNNSYRNCTVLSCSMAHVFGHSLELTGQQEDCSDWTMRVIKLCCIKYFDHSRVTVWSWTDCFIITRTYLQRPGGWRSRNGDSRTLRFLYKLSFTLFSIRVRQSKAIHNSVLQYLVNSTSIHCEQQSLFLVLWTSVKGKFWVNHSMVYLRRQKLRTAPNEECYK